MTAPDNAAPNTPDMSGAVTDGEVMLHPALLTRLRATAALLPDPVIDHVDDCAGSLCETCGHCLHSIAVCACAVCGCHDYIETDDVIFRRTVVRLIDAVLAAPALNSALPSASTTVSPTTAGDSAEVGEARALAVLRAAHRAANELDAGEPYPSTTLGGCSPGGVVRHEVHEGLGLDIDHCPVCIEEAAAQVGAASDGVPTTGIAVSEPR